MKRHESDLLSLVFALVFLLVAALWPLWQLGALGSGTINWLPAAALVLIGLLGLALSVTRSRSTARADRSSIGGYDTGPQYDTGLQYNPGPTYDTGAADPYDTAAGDQYDGPIGDAWDTTTDAPHDERAVNADEDEAAEPTESR